MMTRECFAIMQVHPVHLNAWARVQKSPNRLLGTGERAAIVPVYFKQTTNHQLVFMLKVIPQALTHLQAPARLAIVLGNVKSIENNSCTAAIITFPEHQAIC